MNFKESFLPLNSSSKIMLPIVLVILAIMGALLLPTTSNNQNNTSSHPANTTNQPITFNQTIIYGYWTGSNSLISAFNPQKNKTTLIASLPVSIKKVNFLNAASLLYINATDDNDHGKELVEYLLPEKKTSVIFSVDAGFGIDDYVVSPNKRYVVVWEVKPVPGYSALRNGNSRVYGIDLQNPNSRNLIYNEVASVPIHYPRAVTNEGMVFFDSALPNSGAGWAYGMSVSAIDGSQKRNLENLGNGTYGTQPALSPDGRFLAFAGYQNQASDGAVLIGGFRKAILQPNTIELLDTKTFERKRLTELSPNNIYPSVTWDKEKNLLFFITLSNGGNTTVQNTYDLSQNTFSVLQKMNPNTDVPIAVLQNSQILFGRQDNNNSTLGNLGDSYAHSLSSLSLYNSSTLADQKLSLASPGLIQFITLIPNNEFAKTENLFSSNSNTMLQLGNFIVKPDLAQKRNQLQSLPKKCPIAAAVNSDPYSNNAFSALPAETEKQLQLKNFQPTGIQQLSPTPTITPDDSNCTPLPIPSPTPNVNLPPNTIPTPTETQVPTCAELGCRQLLANHPVGQDQNGTLLYKCSSLYDAICADTPLYLYGPEGKLVKISVDAPVISSNLPYNNGYFVTLMHGGFFKTAGDAYDSIIYTIASPAWDVTKPDYGTVVPVSLLQETLSVYAKNLGLNKKETEDLLEYAKTKIDSSYIFVSFFNENDSKKIVPLTFSPQPDTYINIVFYFKKLQSAPVQLPKSPVFPQIPVRQGFTAVEISEITQ